MSLAWVVTEQDAIDAGMNYKATLYGVPVYVKNPYSEEVAVANKYQVLAWWPRLVDFLVEVVLMFTPSDEYFELPLRNLKSLRPHHE